MYRTLVKMDHFNLQGNELTQEDLVSYLGCNFTNLTNVTVLEARELGLTGSLEPLVRMTSLEQVLLNDNKLTGALEPLLSLPKLKRVDVTMNQLEGVLPMKLINIRMNDGPECVQIYGNLGFTFPHDIGTLPDPCQVDLSMCNLTGELPLAVIRIKLKWWCRVNLADNNGLTLPADMSSLLRDVRSYGEDKLLLRDCSLVGDMSPLGALTKLGHLDRLDLQGNLFAGEVPEVVFDVLCRARKFQLGGNRLGQTTVASYFALNYTNIRDLRHFDLRNKGLKGVLPVSLIHMIQTKGAKVELAGNPGLTLPESLVLLSNEQTALYHVDRVEKLVLPSFALAGTMANVASLPTIMTCDLHANQLTGGLEALAKLTCLTELNLSHNLFEGSLEHLADLVNLTTLNLEHNLCTGTLEGIAGLTKLRDLDLRQNDLRGGLGCLSGLVNLTSLNLAQNALTGDTAALSKLRKLTTLEVWNNKLSGSVRHLIKMPKIECLVLNNPDYAIETYNEFFDPADEAAAEREAMAAAGGIGGGSRGSSKPSTPTQRSLVPNARVSAQWIPVAAPAVLDASADYLETSVIHGEVRQPERPGAGKDHECGRSKVLNKMHPPFPLGQNPEMPPPPKPRADTRHSTRTCFVQL